MFWSRHRWNSIKYFHCNSYIYILICICMGLCVSSWMVGQGGDLISGIFQSMPECPEGLSLSIVTPHKGLCPQKPARPEESLASPEQRACHFGVRPRSSQFGAEKQSVRSRGSVHLGVRHRSRELEN